MLEIGGIQIHFVEVDGKRVPVDFLGYMLNLDEASELVSWLIQFCNEADDEAIAAYNEKNKQFLDDGWKSRSIASQLSKTKPSSGYIYLIHATGTDRYKIGKSIVIPSRLNQLVPQSPYPLTLVDSVFVEDMKFAEDFLHEMFDRQRVNGEWFELDADKVTAVQEAMHRGEQ